MKTGRKHGKPSALAAGPKIPAHQPLPIGGSRVQTSLTLAASRQAYLWFTDRGRSRVLIKF